MMKSVLQVVLIAIVMAAAFTTPVFANDTADTCPMQDIDWQDISAINVIDTRHGSLIDCWYFYPCLMCVKWDSCWNESLGYSYPCCKLKVPWMCRDHYHSKWAC